MPGSNAFAQYEFFKMLCEQETSANSSSNIRGPVFLKLINQAYQWLADETKIELGRQATLDLVAGTSEYALPSDRLGWGIEEIRLLDSAGLDAGALTPRHHSFIRSEYDLSNLSNGTPDEWAISQNDQTKFLIVPPPSYSRNDSIILYYEKVSRIHRLYKPALTITITQGTNSGTLSASSWDAGKIAIGDELAVLPTTDFDAETMTGISDGEWMEITGLSGTAVTFRDVRVGSTATTLGFVSGQVHPIEKTFPGKFGLAPVYWAAHLFALHRDNSVKAAEFEQKAYAAIANKGRGESIIKDNRPSPAEHFSWMR